jgi:hypothetical protein
VQPKGSKKRQRHEPDSATRTETEHRQRRPKLRSHDLLPAPPQLVFSELQYDIVTVVRNRLFRGAYILGWFCYDEIKTGRPVPAALH